VEKGGEIPPPIARAVREPIPHCLQLEDAQSNGCAEVAIQSFKNVVKHFH
jgi:hypothetical protein